MYLKIICVLSLLAVFKAAASPNIADVLGSLTNTENVFDAKSLKFFNTESTIFNDSNTISILNDILNDESSLKALYDNYQLAYSVEFRRNASIYERIKNFRFSVIDVVQHNLDARKGLHLYEKGLNFFSEMSEDEIEEYTHCSPEDFDYLPAVNDEDSIVEDKKRVWDTWELAFEWFWPHCSGSKSGSIECITDRNWTAENIISPVAHQGSCGSCYAFAAITLIESFHSQIRKVPPTVLSKQQLGDCAGYGCNGIQKDEYPDLFDSAKRGLSTEESYPYRGVAGTCNHNVQKQKHFTNTRKVRGNEIDLQKEVAHHPVLIGLCATPFHTYQSGIFDGCLNSHCNGGRNHAVVVTGFGTENSVDYWIIKNSWGTQWGERGYIRLKRNADNMCKVAGEGWKVYGVPHEDLITN